jgi:lysophospholipase L1-like esterase
MHQVLVFGDSLTWGIIPGTRNRLPFQERWPGVLETQLNASGTSVRIIEDCLNGRRTVWEDPFKPGRNGLIGIGQRIEVNSPLSLVILMLGVNDFQVAHPQNDAWMAGRGITALVEEIRRAPIESGMSIPPILIVCPPPIRTPRGEMALKFSGADQRCHGLALAYEEVAKSLGCHFFDAGTIIHASDTDGVHLDRDQHQKFGKAMGKVVPAMLDHSNG